jgi:hypothetical protein
LAPLHTVEASVHIAFEQHGAPAAPQETHTPVWHLVLALVHVAPQQACPNPPQLEHAPLVHAPNVPPHAAPAPTQAPFTQQPPLAHALPAQHGCPDSPHAAQILPVQTVCDAVQTLPGQHGSPTSPQRMQFPLRQAAPAALHVAFSQHDSPAAPHGTQICPLHTDVASHVPPEQHAWPAAPQLTHAPPTHVDPPPHAAAPPHVHAPFVHASEVKGSHATHALPLGPHAEVVVPGAHVAPSQHAPLQPVCIASPHAASHLPVLVLHEVPMGQSPGALHYVPASMAASEAACAA